MCVLKHTIDNKEFAHCNVYKCEIPGIELKTQHIEKSPLIAFFASLHGGGLGVPVSCGVAGILSRSNCFPGQ